MPGGGGAHGWVPHCPLVASQETSNQEATLLIPPKPRTVGEGSLVPGKWVGGPCEEGLPVSCLLLSWAGQPAGLKDTSNATHWAFQDSADGCLAGGRPPGPKQRGLTASPPHPPAPSWQPCSGQVGPRGRGGSSQHMTVNRQG